MRVSLATQRLKVWGEMMLEKLDHAIGYAADRAGPIVVLSIICTWFAGIGVGCFAASRWLLFGLTTEPGTVFSFVFLCGGAAVFGLTLRALYEGWNEE